MVDEQVKTQEELLADGWSFYRGVLKAGEDYSRQVWEKDGERRTFIIKPT